MKKIIYALIVLVLASSCGSSDDGTSGGGTDNFDRGAMLVNWADNIIIPSYEAYNTKLTELKNTTTTFTTTPNETNLVVLRNAWQSAYVSWQDVSMFEIGKADELQLRNWTNIYPADATEIEDKIATGTYNLDLPSSNNEQGFPGLDYLINGVANTDADIVAKYTTDTNAANYIAYLTDLVNKLSNLTTQVVDDWNGTYRATFVANTENTANGSVNRLVNEFIEYYERFVREGKIGFPSGARTGTPLPQNVEAFYKEDISKVLFERSLVATRNFFLGKHFSSATTGSSLKSYLDTLNSMSSNQLLSQVIETQLTATESKAAELSDNFISQIATNNLVMLQTFDELQKVIVLYKNEMVSALNINIVFQDNDGD